MDISLYPVNFSHTLFKLNTEDFTKYFQAILTFSHIDPQQSLVCNKCNIPIIPWTLSQDHIEIRFGRLIDLHFVIPILI